MIAQLTLGIVVQLQISGASCCDSSAVDFKAWIDQMPNDATFAELMPVAADIGKPAGIGESTYQYSAEGVTSIAPKVMLMIAANILLIIDWLLACAIVTIWLPHEYAWKSKAEESGMFVCP